MTRAQKPEREIRELTSGELAAFRQWFEEYDAAEWDKRIEEDALSGKLDGIAEMALAEHKSGKATEL